MEKPFPAYDASSRFRVRIREDQEAKDRWYDRMALRGLRVLAFDESEHDKPLWRGDHSFNSAAAAYSLTNFIEPEVAREHPDWSQKVVHEVAMQRFEKRLRQDLSYERKESAHEESAVVWRPVETENGWELATVYGDKMVTLSELWEHTKEYAAFVGNPTAYNVMEHRTQLAMQEQFLHGNASGFVSVLSHPDSVRYVQLWQRASDGTVVSTNIDLLKTTGRDFSHEEGAQLIQHLRSFNGNDTTDATSYAHFFVLEKTVHEQDIRTFAIAQTIRVWEDTSPSPEPYVPRLMAEVGSKAIADSVDSMGMLGMYLREHIELYLANRRTQFDAGSTERSKGNRERVTKTPSGQKTREIVVRKPRKELSTTKKTMRGVLPHASETVKSMIAEWWVARQMLRNYDVTSVAAVAVLAWMGASPIAPERPLKAPKLNKAKPRRTQTNASSLAEIFRVSLRKREQKKILMKTIRRARTPQAATRKEQLRTPRKVSERVVRTIVTKLKELAVAFPKPHHVPKQRDAVPEPHMIKRLTFALLIWWVIRVVQREEKTYYSVPKRETKERYETHHPWILLSIIWHLVAIREHGKPTAAQNQRKKKKQFPPSGIIFSYQFVIE